VRHENEQQITLVIQNQWNFKGFQICNKVMSSEHILQQQQFGVKTLGSTVLSIAKYIQEFAI